MMRESPGAEHVRLVTELRAKLEHVRDQPCPRCGTEPCGHQILFSIALGLADLPFCLDCLAQSVGRDSAELSHHLLEHFARRACYSEVWGELGQQEGAACRFSSVACVPAESPTTQAAEPENEASEAAVEETQVTWDAGDMACGDLLLELRLRVRRLPPSGVLHLVARDRGAVEDIPAWCRLTGNHLRSAEHPDYWIKRKTE